MGWWWSSSTPANSESASSSSTSTSTPASASAPMHSIPPETQSQPNLDADFHAAYPHLAPDATHGSPTPQSSFTSTAPALSSEYPTTMSCRAAFDSAFYCSSLGGHFNHIYRYGELKPCSEHWADWRFCMGLKTRTKADKAALIQERYRQKEEKLREQPNSEYIWERRAEGERYLGAFKPVAEDGKEQ